MNRFIGLPAGLNAKLIKEIDFSCITPTSREIQDAIDEVKQQMACVTDGGAALAWAQSIDPDFALPAIMTTEWALAAVEKFVLIRLALIFCQWIAVTAAGRITLPSQSSAFIATMMRQPAFEAKLKTTFWRALLFDQEPPAARATLH
jgi:hypothetical protein